MQTNFKITVQKIIAALTLWQFISVGLMAVGTWSPKVAIINAVLIGLFILLAKPYHSILLVIMSIPFYVILPNPILENLPMWRIIFLWLFAVWFVHLMITQREWLLRLFSIQRWNTQKPLTGARLKEIVINSIKRADSRFMAWDKVAVLFIALAFCSLLIARFPVHGLKQIIFLLNIYALYVVIVNVVTDREKLQEIIRYTLYSLLIMVGLGFVQYFSTMFTQPYYFWQYWAMMVSSLYYGTPLANVLAYSNSWFSFSGGSQSLRMFGVLPDTHAFGVICIFLLAYLTPYLKWGRSGVSKWYVYAAVFLAGFGVMANGTRGVWLAMLAPLFIVAIIYGRKMLPHYMKINLTVYGFIIALFILSPFISQGLNLIRTYDSKDNFLNRASSIYDLNESSNAGRLEIWQHSLKFAGLHPFGVGYGNFIVSVVENIPEGTSYEQAADNKNLRFNLPQKFITAHSLYLQLLVELGFAGLLAFGLFWWEYFDRLIRFLRKYKDMLNQYAYLTISLALAFIWILAYGVFDLTILNDRVLQYLFISLAISGLIFAKYDSLKSAE